MVDDITARLLTRLGYEVHVVSSGEDAVENLKENKADILILDMIMAPNIDELETYQRVLEINPNQKTSIVSGFLRRSGSRKPRSWGPAPMSRSPT